MAKKSSRRSSSKKKCPKGQILKKGYTRKGYVRKGSKQRKGSYVSRTRVPATCVKDRGKPGKGPKTLPKLGKEIKLSRFGYSTKKSVPQRRASLRRASKKHNNLKVLRHLNLARNYQADKKVKAKMSADVKYMKERYAKSKKRSYKKRKSYRKKSRRRSK